MKKQLIFVTAIFLLFGCDQPSTADTPHSEQPGVIELNEQQVEQQRQAYKVEEQREAFEDEFEAFRQNSKQTIAQIEERIERAEERAEARAEMREEVREERAEEVQGEITQEVNELQRESKRALTDIKTRLDRIGTDVDKAQVNTEEEFRQFRDDAQSRLQELERASKKLFERDNKGS